MLAPICLFTYNRLFETKKVIEALKRNYLASESLLFIFSDGPKNEIDLIAVNEVRDYLNSICGFKSIFIECSSTNMGLAKSIIFGVSKILRKYKQVIVLEDDLITSSNFLDFMNKALGYYQFNSKVFSISGYTMSLPGLKDLPMDYYVGYRGSSWGWATWSDRWEQVDWELKDFKCFTWKEKKAFRRGGNDLPRMLNNHLNNKIDSWAIRWVYHQFKVDKYTIFPKESKVISIGYGENATHTKKTKRFITDLDPGFKRDFHFDQDLIINLRLAKDFRRKFSILSRLKDRIFKNLTICK